jgi:hypothetical protein
VRNTEAAFRWIVGILQNHNIPFQIGGGFAAQLYGATRELADIDFDIPESRFAELLPEVKQYIKFGPEQYRDDNWDLLLLTLSYEGQDIDICGAYEAKVFDQAQGQWMDIKDDFSTANKLTVYEIDVPIMNKGELIEYKTMLGREVDKIDVAQMTGDS